MAGAYSLTILSGSLSILSPANLAYLKWPSGVHSVNSICATSEALTTGSFAFHLSSRALAMGYSKNDFAGFKSRVPANWLRGETTLGVHFCYCLKFCRRQIYPKWQRFCDLRLKVYGIAIAICPSGKIPGEEKKSWK